MNNIKPLGFPAKMYQDPFNNICTLFWDLSHLYEDLCEPDPHFTKKGFTRRFSFLVKRHITDVLFNKPETDYYAHFNIEDPLNNPVTIKKKDAVLDFVDARSLFDWGDYESYYIPGFLSILKENNYKMPMHLKLGNW